jgi:hypothetical protein
MTIWVERTVNVQDWERIQNLFKEHFSGLKGPHKFEAEEGDSECRAFARVQHLTRRF